MTKKTELDQIKLLAKRYQHALRCSLGDAQNSIARHLGFSHWRALSVKAKKDWDPSAEDVASVEKFVLEYFPSLGNRPQFIEQSLSRPVDEPITVGEIDGHAFKVFEDLGDLRMEGEGWRILIGEPDRSRPVVQIEESTKETCPASVTAFVKKALEIANKQAVKVRANIASDWPKQSTKPNDKGEVKHPLFGGVADNWVCNCCNARVIGRDLAKNLWHCSVCNASPRWISETPIHLGDEQADHFCVDDSTSPARSEPSIEVVDTRPKLHLDRGIIEMWLRLALLEDAQTPGERLAALKARIDVEPDLGASISLDDNFWSEWKDTPATSALAETLELDVWWEAECGEPYHAWPDLSNATQSTAAYVKALIEAHEESGVVLREKSAL
ncbi:hypothetical protein MHM39_02335 [Phaeobacter sp. CNT1-3]|nr:hypothetical protein [Phaeobacter sp. CNT1-3]